MAEPAEHASVVQSTPPRLATTPTHGAPSPETADLVAHEILFETVEWILTEQAPMTLARLGRQVARIAGPLSLGVGLELSNWQALSQAGMTALLMTGALLTPAGRTVVADVTAQATMIGSLRNGYRNPAETYLLERLPGRTG